MNVKLDPDFFKKLKKLDVRIRKSFKEKIAIFVKNPLDPQLNNHKLQEPYLGTHEELYGKPEEDD